MKTDREIILECIENKRWDFRSAEGICRETGIPFTLVIIELDRLCRDKLIRHSDAKGLDDEDLYARKDQQVTLRERLSAIWWRLGHPL